MAKVYYCADCEEDVNVIPGSVLICLVCGGTLTAKPTVGTNNIRQNNRAIPADPMEALFELLGSDLRDAIMESMSLTGPSRQISVDYLSTLGKIVVDEKKTILRDVSLSIGPLHILAVSASFGYLPGQTEEITAELVCASPSSGEGELANTSACTDAMVVLERGVVSFASKSLRAVAAGAKVIIVTQTTGVWPFLMSDSAGEIAASGKELQVPVVMVSQKDGEIIRKLIQEQQSSAQSVIRHSNDTTTATGNGGCRAVLRMGHSVSECSICQEDFQAGANVVKLPCRHLYHTDCVIHWLETNNTCPLCRLELPKETSGKTLPQSHRPVERPNYVL